MLMQAISLLLLTIGMEQALMEPMVKKLGDSDYTVREKSRVLLEKQLAISPWEELLVKGLKKDWKDLEINRQIHFLTHPKWGSSLTVYGKYPWLDSLPRDYPDRGKIISIYWNKAVSVHDGKDYLRWRHATYLWMTDLQKQGHWTSSLRKIQKEMIFNELRWKRDGRYP
ncbi:MAG: hypothetical protein A2908_04140 [Candidatus Staskawiczbacteria bacterium RIFCSPLOWO2_01_FULL_38_12b]|uniref:Uncharacterized protein n=1 Tax=Candidatus Staskawiczbacteria bacterium RIFCSPLOWO2_01_FULL_38_12b TaxID=1802214 RepID=A0A1G2IF96_9BACT|nr:MAG: hypothetical protein A2908_04140 [Candidatus Staskawiczbacteria bacterium RIFCSPLOWO2_01_FULL_38_12b]